MNISSLSFVVSFFQTNLFVTSIDVNSFEICYLMVFPIIEGSPKGEFLNKNLLLESVFKFQNVIHIIYFIRTPFFSSGGEFPSGKEMEIAANRLFTTLLKKQCFHLSLS